MQCMLCVIGRYEHPVKKLCWNLQRSSKSLSFLLILTFQMEEKSNHFVKSKRLKISVFVLCPSPSNYEEKYLIKSMIKFNTNNNWACGQPKPYPSWGDGGLILQCSGYTTILSKKYQIIESTTRTNSLECIYNNVICCLSPLSSVNSPFLLFWKCLVWANHKSWPTKNAK